MKKRILMCILAVLAVFSLVACGGDKEEPFDAAKKVEGFDQAISTTVKFTYVTNFKVDVVRPGGDVSGMTSFMRDVTATATVEMDLGADLYIKVSKTRKDAINAPEETLTEELLYKKEGKYYYQTSSSLAVEVAEADAKAKLETILHDATFEQVGAITVDYLLYNSLSKQYELDVFGGFSEAFFPEDLVDPVYSEGKDGGLHVEYKPEYIGYRTDGGWSDFPGAEGQPAAEITLDTDAKGRVLSWVENYKNPGLVFNIMSNPPTVTISGSRSFTATYGAAITKVEEVALTPSTAVYEAASNGTFVVMTCPMGQFGSLAPVANGGALTMGNIIAVKPTANEGYELASIVVNGQTEPMIDPAMAGGFYCYNVKPGANVIEVSFVAAEPTDAVVTVTNNTSVEYQLQSFEYTNNAPSNYKVITDGIIVPGSSVFGAIVVAAGVEVVVKINGADAAPVIPAGPSTFYCFSVKEGGNYEVVISEKGEAVEGNAKIVVTNDSNVEYKIQWFELVNGAPAGFNDVTNGEIVPGASVWGTIVVSNDTPVSVTVNGAPSSFNLPQATVTYYCFKVVEGGNYEVVITPAA